MEQTYPTQCASCGVDATMTCAGCKDAPEYNPGDAVTSVYCSKACQTEHWQQHKAHCRSLKKRRKLLRAAAILKAALLAYREVIYDVDLTKIELGNGTLYLYQKQRAITTRSKRGPFPTHLTTNVAHKEAALANNQCTTAMALLGHLTRKLLKGIASTIEVLDLHIGNPQTPTKLIPSPDSSECPHTVLKVGRLFTGETWVIDTAGCQYGFREALVPFEKYIVEKACQISHEPTPYDATETKDLDYFATLPFMNRTPAQRDDWKVERRARLHFAKFVDAKVGSDLLDGSAAEFKDRLNGFVQALKAHMLGFS